MTLSDSLPSVARAAMASAAPLIRRQVMRYPPIGREAPVLVPPLVALPQGCCGGSPDPGRPVDLLDGKAERERSDRPGESSLSCRQQIHSTHDSEAKAATERSEGVAEAKREEAPKHSAAGRALAASECEQWARPKAAWIFRMLLQRKGY